MRAKESNLNLMPHLVVEKINTDLEENEMGYLCVSDTLDRLEIGGTNSREFRLVQCLFSPQNFLSAKYNPVTQTLERAFSAIRTSKDTLNKRLLNPEEATHEMGLIIKQVLRNLRGKEVGNYLTFIAEGDKIRMEVTSLVGV